MQKSRGQRINFRIAHCSSEDPEYPVSQLLLQSPNAKGWQSKRFCQFPQTIIYQLVEPTIIKQISILSHQSKIPTKMSIHNKLDTNKDWHKLGYLSLESNVNSNYQARELKTVNLSDKPTLMIKFTFEANYVNSHNVFNQIGVISLCVFGDRMVVGENPKNSISSGSTSQVDKLDKNTLGKLKELQIQKKIAIDQEDYDKAQALKNQIDRIKSIGNTLIALEQRKKKAIEDEDFESAKIFNNKIKQLRDSAGGGGGSSKQSGPPPEYYKPKRVPEYVEQEQPSVSPMTLVKKQQREPVMKRRSPPKKVDPDDDRPIQVKSQNPYENAEDDGKFPGGTQEGEEPGQVQPLTKQIRIQCNRYFSVFDEEIFMHIFSNHHGNREKGLNLAKNQLLNGKHNKNQLTQAFLYIVRKTIDDKNVSVLTASLDLFSTGVRKLKPPQSPDSSQTAEYILQKMNDYLGHSAQKIKRMVEQIYHNLPQYQLTNKDTCYKILTMMYKRDKPPKILTGRLKMIDTIVGNYQLGKNYEPVINFAVEYADDKNSDVRNSAIALICTISNEIGYSSLQPYLKSLRPNILKTVQQKIQQGGDDNRNYQDKPLPGSKKQSIPIKHQKNQQFEQTQNQFIDVPPPKNISNPDYTCQFCQRFDKKFQNQDYRDLHMFNACPMLVICQQCKQAVQVNLYTAHRLSECPNSKYYKKCPRCKQAVHQRNYKAHTQKKQCIPAKGLAVANRCPLCHLDIDPGRDGWISHLAQQGCQNNPRK